MNQLIGFWNLLEMNRWSKEETKLIIDSWDVIPIEELCELLPGRTLHAIKSKATDSGIRNKQEVPQSHPKYLLNHDFFANPNINNCYWAGFIAADGCIFHRGQNSKTLHITLQSSDQNHLEIFKQQIQFTGPLEHKVQKPSCRLHKQKEYYSSTIKFHSVKLCENLLIYWNITPKKSLTLQPPALSSRQQVLSYIIGYIDGDGCISLRNENRKLVLQITSTNELLSWINLQFDNIGIISRPKQYKNNTYRLKFGGENCRTVLKILKNHIIQNNLPCLNRKWDLVTNERLKSKHI